MVNDLRVNPGCKGMWRANSHQTSEWARRKSEEACRLLGIPRSRPFCLGRAMCRWGILGRLGEAFDFGREC